MEPGGKLPNAREEATPAANGGERGLNAHGSWHQELFYFAPDAQIVTDRHGAIVEANHAASLLFHRPKESLTDKPLALLTVEGERQNFSAIIWQLRRGLATHAFKTRFARRDDLPREAYVMGWSSEDGASGRVLHWLARDITELSRS